MTKSSPVQVLIQYAEIIMAAFLEADRSPKKTWTVLESALPQLSSHLSFNTFKIYWPVFIAVREGLDEKVRQLESELQQVRKQLDSQGKIGNHGRLDNEVRQDKINLPKKVTGWNLRRSNDGYIRAYRKIDGKVQSVYIGRSFDADQAKARIQAKEKEIRQKVELVAQKASDASTQGVK